jgi:hypothetical protein
MCRQRYSLFPMEIIDRLCGATPTLCKLQEGLS